MLVDMIWGPVGSLQSVWQTFDHEKQLSDPDCIWIPDHIIGNNMHPELAAEMVGQPADFSFDYWHDPFVTAAVMANRSPDATDYGIGVTDLIRRGPVDIARTAATVSQVIGRPLLLGVGAGELENLVPVDYAMPEKPVGHFEQGIKSLRTIMDTGYYRSASGYETNLGYNEIPAKLYMGGQRPRMMRITAQYGDGWLPAWKMSVEEYAEKTEFLRARSAEFGRPCPDLGMLTTMVIGRSAEQVYADLDRRPLCKLWGLQAPGESWSKLGLQHPSGDGSRGMVDVMIRDLSPDKLRQIADEVSPQIINECYSVGNADELFEQMKAYWQAGMQRCVTCNSFILPPETEEELHWSQREYTRLVQLLRTLD